MMSPRCVIKATKFAGYDLPKNTIVLLNLYSALMDPGYWKDPEEFRPERFLDQKGHLNMSQENYIPMGLGKITVLFLNSQTDKPSQTC